MSLHNPSIDGIGFVCLHRIREAYELHHGRAMSYSEAIRLAFHDLLDSAIGNALSDVTERACGYCSCGADIGNRHADDCVMA